MRRTLLFTNYLIPCRLSTDPEMYDLGWLWMAWMFIICNSIGCGQCLCPKMLSDIFSFSFTLFLPNWLLISIKLYSGIARFPCDSMAFLLIRSSLNLVCKSHVVVFLCCILDGYLIQIQRLYREQFICNICTISVRLSPTQHTLLTGVSAQQRPRIADLPPIRQSILVTDRHPFVCLSVPWLRFTQNRNATETLNLL